LSINSCQNPKRRRATTFSLLLGFFEMDVLVIFILVVINALKITEKIIG